LVEGPRREINPGKDEDGRHSEYNIISIRRKRKKNGGLRSSAMSD